MSTAEILSHLSTFSEKNHPEIFSKNSKPAKNTYLKKCRTCQAFFTAQGTRDHLCGLCMAKVNFLSLYLNIRCF